MSKVFIKIFILFLFTTVLTAQNNYVPSYPYSNSIVLSLGGGLTKGETDYTNSDFGFNGKGSIEYFIKSNSSLSFGLHLDGRSSVIYGDGRTSPFTEDFLSTLYSLGVGASLNFKLSNRLVPFASLEIQNIWIDVTQYSNPQTPNIEVMTDKTAINLLSEFGVRYIISELFSINASVGLNFVNADHIDGLSISSTSNDYFSTFNLGLSYALSLSEPDDKDGDGIKDSDDNCPYQEEDFDGFEDADGCPEYDNDGDGIIDSKDKCPNEAEDFDGFEDKDGCPDLDNDNDGIKDVDDKCPDKKEDLDGFEDEDGCPDFDNDKDGILDYLDKCPNLPETFNNFEDGDGCPDTIPVVKKIEEPKVPEPTPEPKIEAPKQISKTLLPSEFLIEGKSTFDNGSASIRNGAHSALNQIAEQISNSPGYRWRIEGHMDNSGTPFEVKALSTARANAVLDYLVSKGLPKNSMEAVGLGDQFPASSNSTAFGREKNRRVVIRRIR